MAPFAFFYNEVLKLQLPKGKQWIITISQNQTELIIKQLAINENIKKQEFIIFNKIVKHEICYSINESPEISEARFYNRVHKKTLKHYRKIVKNNYKFYLEKYNKIFSKTILKQSEREYKDHNNNYTKSFINPNVNLSYNKIGKLINRSKSTGNYQMNKLINLGFYISENTFYQYSEKDNVSNDFNRSFYGEENRSGGWKNYFKHYVSKQIIKKYYYQLPNQYSIIANNILNNFVIAGEKTKQSEMISFLGQSLYSKLSQMNLL